MKIRETNRLHSRLREHDEEWFDIDVPDYDEEIERQHVLKTLDEYIFDDYIDRRPVLGAMITMCSVVGFGLGCYFLMKWIL